MNEKTCKKDSSPKTKPRLFRLNLEADSMLLAVERKTGWSKTAIAEFAICRMAGHVPALEAEARKALAQVVAEHMHNLPPEEMESKQSRRIRTLVKEFEMKPVSIQSPKSK